MLNSFNKDVRVLFLDPLPSTAVEIFRTSGFKIDECFEKLTEAQLVKKITEYNVVCLSYQVWSQAACYWSLWQNANCVDLEVAQSMGIPVFTSPFQHQGSVAEITISFIVLLARQIGDRSKEIHTGEWNKMSAGCTEVRGKTIGIVGYGQVGSQLGVMAEALSLEVVFYDTQSVMPMGRAKARKTLDEVLKESDYVALNVTSTPENVKLIGKRELGLMKKTAFLINASYGEAVDIDALAEAIKAGTIRGCALDAFPNQPNGKKAEFKTHSKDLRTCDITVEGEMRVGTEVANALVNNIKLGSTVGTANFPSISAWPLKPGTRRIINVHRNVRGVLQEIDYILSSYNVGKQILDTKESLGYIIADIATEEVTTEIVSQLALLAHTVKTRIL
ncbi:hypothetical protein BCR33DRAFT_735298 [Rhizoclosmatium globosum]|uniref:D-isomer specific 2-hydroxyacid dehydrogenase NAD-binding domain-containing protein n=1 Tax=Rhizoclosmatium globosum TaxID=329046 RepID=A0A1Y2CQ43_9FUNG|nr:hypothetical protein BCR33DRAFT_735298 [Rhizoclosmatium globosum]|eukprot:ORY49158.1 hypothetical protein BCR33DRAFT_735298 [Rhizoclosmatium globosum]